MSRRCCVLVWRRSDEWRRTRHKISISFSTCSKGLRKDRPNRGCDASSTKGFRRSSADMLWRSSSGLDGMVSRHDQIAVGSGRLRNPYKPVIAKVTNLFYHLHAKCFRGVHNRSGRGWGMLEDIIIVSRVLGFVWFVLRADQGREQ